MGPRSSKRPDDRYPSAGAIADDIDNYLRGDPLTARFPTAFYFLRKKAKKHRLPLSFAAAALVCITTVGVLGSVQVARQRDLAVASAKDEHALREIAELRLADGLTSWGQSLAERGRWIEAKSKYDDAREIQLDHHVPVTVTDLGILDACRHVPMPLSEWAGPSQPVTSKYLQCAIKTDDRSVLCPEKDGTLSTYDMITGQLVSSTGTPMTNGYVLSAQVDNERKSVLRCCSAAPRTRPLNAWWIEKVSVADGSIIHRFDCKDALLQEAALSPDGRYAAAETSTGGNSKCDLFLWDFVSKSARVIAHDIAGMPSLVFSSDSRELAGTGGGRLYRWDVATGEARPEIVPVPLTPDQQAAGDDAPGKLVGSPVYLTNGAGLVVSGDENNLLMVNTVSHSLVAAFPQGDVAVRALAVSPDSSVVMSADARGLIRLSSVQTGETLRLLDAGKPVVNGCFSPDGQIVFARTSNNTFKAWSADVTRLTVLHTHPTNPTLLVFSPDDRVVAAYDSRDIQIIDLSTGRLLRSIPFPAPLSSLAFNPTGRFLLAARNDCKVTRLTVFGDVQQEVCAAGCPSSLIPDLPPAKARAICVNTFLSADGKRAVALTAKGTALIDVEHGVAIRMLTTTFDLAACISTDARIAAICHGGSTPSIQFVTTDGDAVTRTPIDIRASLQCLAISRSNDFAVVGFADGSISAIEVASAKILWTAQAHSGQLNCLSISPDGTCVLSGGADGLLKLWDLKQGRELQVLAKGLPHLSSADFSRDGSRIACNGGPHGETYLWDLTFPARLNEAHTRSADLHHNFISNSASADSIDSVITSADLCGVTAWSKQLLLMSAQGRRPSLNLARWQWRAEKYTAASESFGALAATESDPHLKDYLAACQEAARRSGP